MNILVLGSGGREHALVWKLKQSSKCTNLYAAPGNAGTAGICTNVSLAFTDFEAILSFCEAQKIAMLVVGPEEPLVLGIVDFFAEKMPALMVIGPDAHGARLEGSKEFSKAFMQQYGIPTAKAYTATAANLLQAKTYMAGMATPIVLKADGLAAGKGVLICETLQAAETGLDEMLLHGKFGKAGATVLIEEFLNGIELSVFVLTDGKGNYCLLPEAKDYKRVGEGDTGLNTGGMGAVSPVPFAHAEFMQKVEERVVKPTVAGIVHRGMNYRGFVFIGLMNVAGDPFVIEYNCRLGDPETEVVLPRIENDLVELFAAMHRGELSENRMKISPLHCTTIMLVSGGYPEEYQKGIPVSGLELPEGILAFHAGTTWVAGQVHTAGGRVLALTALGHTRDEALAMSNVAAAAVQFQGKYYRRDIGLDLQ